MLCPSCKVIICDKEKNLTGFLSVCHPRTANGSFGMFCGWTAKEGCVIALFQSFRCSDWTLCRSKAGNLSCPWRADLQPCQPMGTTARAGHWGQQGHSLQQKPDWKFPEKRRGLETSWIQDEELRKKIFSRNQRDSVKFDLIRKPLSQWTEKQNRRTISFPASGRQE